MCKNEYCRKKLKEYRELTTKLYDDIDGLESDIKDKDDFLQTVIKARNACQSEIAVLKKKNSQLIKENNDLLEKNDQLDEDAETGLTMVRNAHERERKINSELNDCRANVSKKVEKLTEVEKENEDLNSKLNFLKQIFGNCLKENQEMSISSQTKIKDLENKILEYKERTEKIETDQNHFAIGTEVKLKEQALFLETLTEENENLKQNNSDLIDELLVKKKEVQDLEEDNEKTKLKSSSNSLKEELQEIEMYKCEPCSLSFINPTKLREHMKTLHLEKLNRRLIAMTNLNKLEVKLSEQRFSVTTSLFKLKNEEDYEKHNCRCKGYCRIYHQKHNFVKSKSDELFSRLESFSEIDKIGKSSKTTFLGALRKCYNCTLCERTFSKQGDLKRHKKHEHKPREEESREVEEIVQTGRMS